MCDANDLNCCQLCAYKLCAKTGADISKRDLILLSGYGDGLGVGGPCGALLGAVAGACITAKGIGAEKIRLSIIMDFMEHFSTVNCSKLEAYYENGCQEVISYAIDSALKAIKNSQD